MSHARETTLFIDFLKNPSIIPLGIFLVNLHLQPWLHQWTFPKLILGKFTLETQM